jgi:hypothetical protein
LEFDGLGELKSKLHHPMVLPQASNQASFLCAVVKVLLNRMSVNKKQMQFHFKRSFHLGLGHFIRQTYQPFRTTILP